MRRNLERGGLCVVCGTRQPSRAVGRPDRRLSEYRSMSVECETGALKFECIVAINITLDLQYAS